MKKGRKILGKPNAERAKHLRKIGKKLFWKAFRRGVKSGNLQ